MKASLVGHAAVLRLLGPPAFLCMALAQQTAAQPVVIRTETRLVQVDAIVRDKKGKIMSDLGARDFRLWEDGKEQPITRFSLEEADSPREPEPQYMAFLFDSSGVPPLMRIAADKAARQDVADFAGAYAGPGRYMAVMTFNGELSIAQNFTSLAERVQKASGDTTHLADAATKPNYFRFVSPSVDNIRAIANSMAVLRGRKSLVVLRTFPLFAPYAQLEAAAQDCNRANVSIYTTNPGLKTLAEETGGRWLPNNLDRQLGDIVDAQKKAYVLGFKPVESPDGSCHSLRVRTTRGGLEVNARDSYCNVKAPDLLAGKVVGRALEERAAGPLAGNAAASMELPYFYSSPGIALVDLAMEMDLAELKFTKTNGKQHAEMDLVGLAYGADGEVAARFSDAVSLDFGTTQEVEAFWGQPYRYERQFRLPSGRYNLRVAFGSGDRNFGKAEAPLTIDPWDGQHLALSGIALSSDVRKASDLAVDLDPSLLEGHKDLIAKSLRISPSGSNNFLGFAPCFGYLEVFNPPPELQIRVLDRRTGEEKQVGSIDPADYMRPGNPVVPVLLNIPIAPLPRGSYVLEVKASPPPGAQPVVRTVEFQISEQGAPAPGGDRTAEGMFQMPSALPESPPPATPSAQDSQPPSGPERERILAAARQVALAYAGLLPNLLCTQTVRRSVDRGRGFAKADTLTVEVGYYQQQERYHLAEVNGNPVDMFYSDATGMISRGEFGANMRTIFDPASAAEFRFQRWTTVGNRRAAVYSFRVERSKAHYQITTHDGGPGGDKIQREQSGLRGEAVIDTETYGILRLNYAADAIPPGFPVRRIAATVDYGDAEIGGAPYRLPLKAVVELQDKLQIARNEVTFHSYRKFSSDSSISFGDEEPKRQP
jgi:VWFA-related protein